MLEKTTRVLFSDSSPHLTLTTCDFGPLTFYLPQCGSQQIINAECSTTFRYEWSLGENVNYGLSCLDNHVEKLTILGDTTAQK